MLVYASDWLEAKLRKQPGCLDAILGMLPQLCKGLQPSSGDESLQKLLTALSDLCPRRKPRVQLLYSLCRHCACNGSCAPDLRAYAVLGRTLDWEDVSFPEAIARAQLPARWHRCVLQHAAGMCGGADACKCRQALSADVFSGACACTELPDTFFAPGQGALRVMQEDLASFVRVESFMKLEAALFAVDDSGQALTDTQIEPSMWPIGQVQVRGASVSVHFAAGAQVGLAFAAVLPLTAHWLTRLQNELRSNPPLTARRKRSRSGSLLPDKHFVTLEPGCNALHFRTREAQADTGSGNLQMVVIGMRERSTTRSRACEREQYWAWSGKHVEDVPSAGHLRTLELLRRMTESTACIMAEQ